MDTIDTTDSMNTDSAESQHVPAPVHGVAYVVEGIIAALTVVVAITAFVVIGLPGLAPKPLAEADPTAAASLRDQIPVVESAISNAQNAIGYVTGTDAAPATEGTNGRLAQLNTWLASDDPSVADIQAVVTLCTQTVAQANVLLDPERTLAGTSDQADDSSTPRIISFDTVRDVSQALASCVPDLGSARMDATAALEAARTAASDQAATADNTAARTELQSAIDAANGVLSGSEGKVSDDAVRQTLAAAITTAADALAAEAPATGWAQIDQDTTTVTAAAMALSGASDAVTQAQSDWQAAQDAAAAQNTGGSGNGSTGGRSGSTGGRSGGTSGGASSGTNSGGGGGGGGGFDPSTIPTTLTLSACLVEAQGYHIGISSMGYPRSTYVSWTIGPKSGGATFAGSNGISYPANTTGVTSVSCTMTANGQTVGTGGSITIYG